MEETEVFAAAGLVFAAFCIWLGIRIANRREKRAKRTAIALAVLMLVYVLSIGPVNWIESRVETPEFVEEAQYHFYYPLDSIMMYGPEWLRTSLFWWKELGEMPYEGAPIINPRMAPDLDSQASPINTHAP